MTQQVVLLLKNPQNMTQQVVLLSKNPQNMTQQVVLLSKNPQNMTQQHINELSMKLDIEEILQKAEGICLQIRSCKEVPESVSSILGFHSEVSDSDLTDPGSRPGAGPRPAQRHDACSNGHGHLRETSSHNGCKVAFIS
ncbi:hypothetical protein INR49_021238 [Caranx melampygus]|nr:hypothetical protein INR49_021238 [Caranx melampygus]